MADGPMALIASSTFTGTLGPNAKTILLSWFVLITAGQLGLFVLLLTLAFAKSITPRIPALWNLLVVVLLSSPVLCTLYILSSVRWGVYLGEHLQILLRRLAGTISSLSPMLCAGSSQAWFGYGVSQFVPLPAMDSTLPK